MMRRSCRSTKRSVTPFWLMWVMAIQRVSAHPQRAVGDRSYKALWRRYRARVMIAMSSQMFAQLVRFLLMFCLTKRKLTRQNGINGE